MKEEDLDWDMTDQFYTENTEKSSLSLEDFLEDSHDQKEINSTTYHGLLNKTINDVRHVKAACAEGQTIYQIAQSLDLSEEYVSNILITIQGASGEDEIAIARLILFE